MTDIEARRTATDQNPAFEPTTSSAQTGDDAVTPNRIRVLISDDLPLIADTVAAVLELNGFRTMSVYCAEEAIAAAATFRPDIFLTDVLMQGMTGIEAAIHVSKELPACTSILLSGVAFNSEILRDAESRGYSFQILPKPIAPNDLVECLRRVGTAGK